MRVRSPCVLHQPAARAPPGSSAARGARLPGPGRAGPLRPAPPAAAHSCQSVSPCGFLPFTFPFSETESAEPPSPGVSEKFTKGRGFGSGRAGRGWGAVAPRKPQPHVWGGADFRGGGQKRGRKAPKKTQARPRPHAAAAPARPGRGRRGRRAGRAAVWAPGPGEDSFEGLCLSRAEAGACEEGGVGRALAAACGARGAWRPARGHSAQPRPPAWAAAAPLLSQAGGGGLLAAGRGAPPRGRRLFQGGSVRRPARPWGPAPSW